METTSCYECGNQVLVSDDGVARHLTEEGEIDYDQDADHVAIPDALSTQETL